MALGYRRAGAAFKHLACVPGRRRRYAVVHGKGRPRRRIGAAAGEDHLRAVVQRLEIGFRSHHPDNMLRTVYRLRGELAGAAQRMSLAGARPFLEPRLVHIRADHRQHEMKPFLARDLVQDLDARLEMRFAASTAASPYHHGDFVRHRAFQEQRHVALHGHAAVDAFAGAEVMRSRVGAATVDADHVQFASESPFERVLRKTIAQQTAGREHAYFIIHLRTLLSFRIFTARRRSAISPRA